MSLHSRDRGRVRFHLYVSDDQDQRFIGAQSARRFRGFRPDIRPSWRKSCFSEAAVNHGPYNCQRDKEGTLHQQRNYLKHQNFALEQTWIIAFWKVRKLSTEIAVREAKQARGSTISYLRVLAKIDEIDEEEYQGRATKNPRTNRSQQNSFPLDLGRRTVEEAIPGVD
jgi:hypothetical protein